VRGLSGVPVSLSLCGVFTISIKQVLCYVLYTDTRTYTKHARQANGISQGVDGAASHPHIHHLLCTS